MKPQKILLRVFSICIISIFLSGYASAADLNNDFQSFPEIQDSVNSNAKIYFSIVDRRPEPDIIGYKCNKYGIRFKKVRSDDYDISKKIKAQYIEELSKHGFLFTDDINNNDLKLKLTINSFIAESVPGITKWTTKGECCVIVSLASDNDSFDILKNDFCGHGEVKSAFWKKDVITDAVWSAVDDVLNKLLQETTLIKSINESTK